MDASAGFWDKIADRYSKMPVADEAAYQRKLEVTRKYLRPDMEVLELGCGTGSTAIAHSPYVKHIRAVDISPKMFGIARAKAADRGVENLSFQQASIDELDVADQSVDVVLTLSLLHVVEDRAAVIAKVHKALKPGGVFVSSTTCLGDSMKFVKLIAPLGRALGLMPLVKVFRAKELSEGIASAGFAIEHEWQPGKNKAVFIVARAC